MAALAVAAAVIVAPGAREAGAQQASGYAELTASRTDAESEDSAGRKSETRNESFLQRYSLDLSWRLYPNFQVLAGGLFERDDSTVTGDLQDSDVTERRIRPYLNASLRTAIYSALFGFYRTEDAVKSGGFSSRIIQDISNGTLAWRPEALPTVTLRYLRTETYDPGRSARDTGDDLFDLVADYQPVESVQVYYRGAIEDFRDRLEDITLRRASHAGRVTYSDSWWRQRIQVSGEYDVNYRSTDVTAGGGGDILSPLFPIAGLSLVTDTPPDGTLLPNPALIDDERTMSAGINLGLPPPGGDERPRNIGLDFGLPTRVNTLLLWVDRVLPADIAGSFSWSIYTSDDNVTWIVEPQAPQVTFGPFENRFEIRFADLTSRYIKAVTRPLARTVSNADRFPDILVTELAAALRTPAAEAQGRSSQTTQLLTTNLRARLMSRPNLYYEFAYFVRDVGASPSTYTMSNGFSLLHAFNPKYSAVARAAREDSRETQGDRLTYTYSASVRAVPVPALQSSLVFSGRSSDMEGRPSSSRSVFLYTTADLYRGVNALVSVGQSTSEGEAGERTDTTQINAQATLVPHRTVTLNLLVQSNTGTRSLAATGGDDAIGLRARQASLSYTPVSTLYFFVSLRTERDVRSDRERSLRNYSVNWSPFPDGSLQFSFRYDESYQSDLDALSRIFSPRLRWNITDRWYVEAAYERVAYDSDLELRSANALTATTRIFF